MTDQKRKRRTFWEPESPAVQEWLANQKDLGMSLQLIIVDAINAYGSGDVIQTHLSNRMNGQVAAPAPAPTVDALVQQAVQQAPQQLAPQAPRPPAPHVTQAQPTPVQQASFTPEPAPQPQRKPVAPQANDADPLAVMFGDLGSQTR